MELPDITVTAQREPEPAREVPASVTAVTRADIARGDITSVKDAAQRAPNVNLIEFTARAISNPQFRGVGGSTTNPGVTTYIDGVPQLSADTSSIELLDIERIEFVRGAQGTLYGRNTLGGVINIISAGPGAEWSADGAQVFGNFERRDLRGGVSGPLPGSDFAAGLAAGFSARQGYSVNDFTGNDLDSRSARFGKGQLAWFPAGPWHARLIVVGEDAADGDFALQDLAQLRQNPRRVNHDFEGYTERRIFGQTLQLEYEGALVRVESITGNQRYRAFETTDLDLSPDPNLTRRNRRKGGQFTQELRVVAQSPWALSESVGLQIQGGLFGFTQDNDQAVVNFIGVPFLVANAGSFFPLPVSLPSLPAIPGLDLLALDPVEDRTQAALDDAGIGAHVEGRFLFGEHWSVSLGLRQDFERKRADITASTVLPLAAGQTLPLGNPSRVDQTRRYTATTPRLTARWMPNARINTYASAARGYRAGGFNPVAPEGFAAYDEEHSSNYELGAKTRSLGGRLSADLALFQIELDDLQLNIPDPGTPGRFYIDNAGQARNRGAELELRGRVLPDFTLFATLGYLDARFGDGSRDMGVDVSGNRVPFAERVTVYAGSDYVYRFGSGLALGLRAEYLRGGDYPYDAQNQRRLNPVELVNLRVSLSGAAWRLEAGARNLFDREYIPLVIPYTGIAPSGFVGESAAPRSFGVTLSAGF